ncbi:hypothetical protein BN1051_03060 [Arthrobacter saudimassiliensis]|uniref:Uncharacterized protein n=1 Tax=Arthrobacter saudimassiliensis TaxID=1461584 RepID=A0A078MR68_9MICC|nr:hypothetical protein BN1051_03060 [Arthrobacter saudimassiliensis]
MELIFRRVTCGLPQILIAGCRHFYQLPEVALRPRPELQPCVPQLCPYLEYGRSNVFRVSGFERHRHGVERSKGSPKMQVRYQVVQCLHLNERRFTASLKTFRQEGDKSAYEGSDEHPKNLRQPRHCVSLILFLPEGGWKRRLRAGMSPAIDSEHPLASKVILRDTAGDSVDVAAKTPAMAEELGRLPSLAPRLGVPAPWMPHLPPGHINHLAPATAGRASSGPPHAASRRAPARRPAPPGARGCRRSPGLLHGRARRRGPAVPPSGNIRIPTRAPRRSGRPAEPPPPRRSAPADTAGRSVPRG